MRPYSCVLFDLFETLVTELNTAPPRASSLGERLGLDPGRFRAEWRRRRPDVLLGRCSFRQALAETTIALGGGITEEALESICAERVRAKASVLHSVEPPVLATLEALRRRGLNLGVVSNCMSEDVAAWGESTLRPYFQVVVFSFGAGLAKPDPRIYRLACRQLGVEPGSTLFIADGANDELTGAERAGLSARRALWFLGRWPGVRLGAGAPGLHSIGDVLTLVEGRRV